MDSAACEFVLKALRFSAATGRVQTPGADMAARAKPGAGGRAHRPVGRSAHCSALQVLVSAAEVFHNFLWPDTTLGIETPEDPTVSCGQPKGEDPTWSGPTRLSSAARALGEGHSTAEIGRRLGVSKNAVVGKAHRLDLPARPSPIRREGERPPPRSSPPRRIAGPTLPPLSSASLGGTSLASGGALGGAGGTIAAASSCRHGPRAPMASRPAPSRLASH